MSIECAFFGSLTKDAELKTSKNDRQYLRCNVRVENGAKSEFINTTVFDADAIANANKLKTGSRVYIEGRLSLDTWTGQDGTAKTGLSCMSGHCRLSQIGRAKTTGREIASRSAQALVGGAATAFDDEVPFAPEVR
jgi:single-stranded DNA-binding protein